MMWRWWRRRATPQMAVPHSGNGREAEAREKLRRTEAKMATAHVLSYRADRLAEEVHRALHLRPQAGR